MMQGKIQNENVWDVGELSVRVLISGEGSKEWDAEHDGGISFEVEGPNAHPGRVPERKMGKMN